MALRKEEILYRIVEFLERDIRGRPLYSWLLLGVLYSFVIWLPLAGWVGYQKYQKYKELEEIKAQKLRLLHLKERQIISYKRKLKEIEIAYKTLHVFFSDGKLAKLERIVNGKLDNFQSGKAKYIETPLVYRTFNYPLRLPKLPIDGQTLDGVTFTSKTVMDFQTAVNYFYRKYKDLKRNPLRGKVEASLSGNEVVLTLKRSPKGTVLIFPVRYLGFISDMRKLGDIPVSGFKTSTQEGFWSEIFLGWNLKLDNERSGGF